MGIFLDALPSRPVANEAATGDLRSRYAAAAADLRGIWAGLGERA